MLKHEKQNSEVPKDFKNLVILLWYTILHNKIDFLIFKFKHSALSYFIHVEAGILKLFLI